MGKERHQNLGEKFKSPSPSSSLENAPPFSPHYRLLHVGKEGSEPRGQVFPGGDPEGDLGGELLCSCMLT